MDVERIQKPLLETSWTEHMLVTPIRSNIFPHSAMPHYKPRSTDIMTKSLSLLLNKNDNGSLLNMSKSLASFHLTGETKECVKAYLSFCLEAKISLRNINLIQKRIIYNP